MFTPLESARLRLPDKPDDALHDLLWNVTCFPFGRPRRWLGQLVAFDYWKHQGLSVCMACGNPYKHKSGKIWADQCCETCEEILKGGDVKCAPPKSNVHAVGMTR